MSLLNEILQQRLSTRDESEPLFELRERANNVEVSRQFLPSLRKSNSLSVIAEIKFRSPSQGELRQDRDVEQIASAYQQNGASALSVLTESHYFDGKLDYLRRARAASTLPILRKDFLWDERDLLESKLHGADAILLIAKMLDRGRLLDLRFLAKELALSVLLEIHDESDLGKAHDITGVAWGVNHRNLDTLEIDLDTSSRLFPLLPDSEIKVAESGIETREQMAEMRNRRADAVLVGTSLMKNPDPGLALSKLFA